MSGLRILFMGTPEFAVPSLGAILVAGHTIVGVVTQPDKPTGRGKVLTAPPVKNFAVNHKIPVFQPERVSREIDEILLNTGGADVIVTCAFGQILKQNVIDACRFGVVNVHASILPKYRGANPIAAAILNGETETGVTIMQTDIGIDTGDMIKIVKTAIEPTETTGELSVRLAKIGAEALVEVLNTLSVGGKIVKTPQNHHAASYFPMFKREFARIDFKKSPKEIVNLVRAMNPNPVAFADSTCGEVKIYRAHVGTAADRYGLVGQLVVDEIKAPGGRVLSYKDFLNGHKGFEFK